LTDTIRRAQSRSATRNGHTTGRAAPGPVRVEVEPGLGVSRPPARPGDEAGRTGAERRGPSGGGGVSAQPDRVADSGGPADSEADRGEAVRSRVRAAVGREVFDRYFDARTRLTLEAGTLVVAAPTRFVADVLKRKFVSALRDAASEVLGRPESEVSVRFRAAPVAAPPVPGGSSEDGAERSGAPLAEARSRSWARGPARAPRQGAKHAERFELDRFIVGESNRLAFGAARELASADGPTALSPLFIHSSWGLGKTHLLHGIAQAVRARRPGARVRYTTGEQFTNEFIAAVRNNALDGFRRSLRSLDLLCLDDVHFLSDKTKTQSELLHTFDAIASEGARVVFASDGHPRDMRALSAALVSRLLSGMVVRIDPPEDGLRVQLVRTLAERRGLRIDDAAIALIAERVARFPSGRGEGGPGGSVRDIEGMLTQVEAVANLLPELCSEPGRVGAALVHRALGLATASEDGSSAPRRPIHVETISSEVCAYLRVDLTEMLGRGRHKRVVLARSLTAHLARRMTSLSYPEIARAMNRPNHSTIITACNRIGAQLDAGERLQLGSEFDGMTLAEVRDTLARRVEKAALGG